MSRRRVDMSAGLGPWGRDSMITGSIRMSVEKRRGWVMDRWTLRVEALSVLIFLFFLWEE